MKKQYTKAIKKKKDVDLLLQLRENSYNTITKKTIATELKIREYF